MKKTTFQSENFVSKVLAVYLSQQLSISFKKFSFSIFELIKGVRESPDACTTRYTFFAGSCTTTKVQKVMTRKITLQELLEFSVAVAWGSDFNRNNENSCPVGHFLGRFVPDSGRKLRRKLVLFQRRNDWQNRAHCEEISKEQWA